MATENEAVATGSFRELSAMTLDEVAIVVSTKDTRQINCFDLAR
jgi:hypothetical protein